MRICDSIGPAKLYKNRYCIAFYDKADENLLHLFDNINEIVKFQNRELTNTIRKQIAILLCKALRRKEHLCNFLTGQTMRVYLIDMAED